MPRTSAGLLMFRRAGDTLEVLLAHPGGPFFRKKDDGVWTIPKGEVEPSEDLLSRARTEFEAEVGIPANGDWIDLGWIKQKGGKTVYAWAFEGNLPDPFQVCSNNFEMEWPPKSGKMQSFPEVDKAEWVSIKVAKEKINQGQLPLLNELAGIVRNN